VLSGLLGAGFAYLAMNIGTFALFGARDWEPTAVEQRLTIASFLLAVLAIVLAAFGVWLFRYAFSAKR
jgi:uncharacterized membrane protein